MFIVNLKTKEVYNSRELEKAEVLKVLSNKIRLKILEMLAEKPTYPRNIAFKLKLHEQKVYYHLNLLKKYDLIEEETKNFIKIYKTKPLAYCFIPKFAEKIEINLKEFFPSPPEILKNFVKDSEINCKIVVGASYPHGKFSKGSKSNYLSGDIAVLLGKYGESKNRLIYTDEELRKEDKKDNLIILGGIYVNTLQKEVNEYLPIKFDEHGTKIISTISKEEYVDPDCGFICKAKNPFDKRKDIIVIAGLESASTKACIFAFKHELEKINKGNMYNRKIKAKVVKLVEGSIVFLE